MGFGLVVGFIEHLQILTTSNYSAIAISHTLQFTTARTKSPQSAVFTSGGNTGDRSQQCPLLPAGDRPTTTPTLLIRVRASVTLRLTV
jgi:hypothetical protein